MCCRRYSRRSATGIGRGHGRRPRRRDDHRIWPGLHDRAFGIAFDVGSTTVAGHLCDLSHGRGARVGGRDEPADPLRRGSDEPRLVRDAPPGLGEGADASVVRGCLAKLTAELASAAEIDRDRHPRGHARRQPDHAPPPARNRPDTRSAAHRSRSPSTRPSGCRHASSDCPFTRAPAPTSSRASRATSAPTPPASSSPRARTSVDEVNLIVDVGTNAEIVLGNRDRLLAASSPTGPAFEGAQISCGQRAAPGAIERVRIDPETLEPRIRVIGCDAWSDEPGFADTHVTGVCGSGIIEAIAELHLAGVLTTDGTIDGGSAEPLAAHRRRRTHLLLRPLGGRAGVRHHPERRATDPARQGGALRGLRLADGALRDRDGRSRYAWPAPSGRTSTPFTRSCSGSCPTASRSA